MKACVFINLPAAADRRASVEASFAAAQTAGWTLDRFEALDPSEVADTPGDLKPAEKACFASHRGALGRHLADEEPLLIVEDDTVFAPQALAVLDALLGRFTDWDVIYTDVALFDLASMLRLARGRDAMARAGEFSILALDAIPYAGAGAYAVRGGAKRRLHAALSAPAGLDQPIDLFLRDLARGPDFRFGACVPFLTAPAELADQGSQIQAQDSALFDATLNIFRRTMWIARDPEQSARDAAWLAAQAPGETEQLLGGLFSVLAAPAFPLDR
ncbi:hypothetical protein [Phenylobacterium sp.]|uniref:glycosyltransferase family 25 protein n=1 Tax=Phenylobacterium sp. TaxID=1871053 RepID=UPI002BC5DC63|nr:hypothetical protein [Phenylobacterium sp.]HLZ73576.1 hypothetical protein [Phenylobacterium sp.]